MGWYKRKDGKDVLKVGRYKVLEIWKRPHKGYACNVFDKGECIGFNGYHTTIFKRKYLAVRWGSDLARELKLF